MRTFLLSFFLAIAIKEVNAQGAIFPTTIRISGGAALGAVLTSDAAGNASWSNVVNWKTNGNVSTSGAFLGTNDANPLIFRANGVKSGELNNGTRNAFFGLEAGLNIGAGTSNTGIGSEALKANVSGTHNTAIGFQALLVSTANGETDNTAIGERTLVANTTGISNTAVGGAALEMNTTGSCNTALGWNTDVGSGNLTNATAIGCNTVVTTSNTVEIGNAVSIVHGPVAYTFSDARFKENIKEEVKGLEFIKLLRPVVYNFNTRKFQEFKTKNMSPEISKKYFEGIDFTPSTAIRQSGFIAQEVEKAANEAGYDFNGVHKPVDENDNYSLAYGEFVVPLVKAMQEQQEMIEAQQKIITTLQDQVAILIEASNTNIGSINTANANTSDVSLSNKNIVVLEQNVPNPFAEQTTISYFLPENVVSAEINFYEKTGKMIKTVSLTEKGNGMLNVFASDLSNGTYSYSLVVDGIIVETKKMVRTK